MALEERDRARHECPRKLQEVSLERRNITVIPGILQNEMEKKGWENVLNEYVFAGDERADDLLGRLTLVSGTSGLWLLDYL